MIMAERKKVDLHTYMSADSVPDSAMDAVDALDLAQQMVRANMTIPDQVQAAVDAQLNPTPKAKWTLRAEPYNGRVRIVGLLKRRLPWQGPPDLND